MVPFQVPYARPSGWARIETLVYGDAAGMITVCPAFGLGED